MDGLTHRILLTPGPIEVHPEVRAAMGIPMISHRGREYSELHASVREKLRRFLGTRGHIFLLTASGTGAMEAVVRNLTRRRALITTCGAFSERWHQIAQANGRPADALCVEWGQPITSELVEERLGRGDYDLVTVTHNETSTGVMNPLGEIARVVKSRPGVLLAVDAVSSMAGVPIDIDGWGIDFVFASVQKAFGLPPGLTVMVASDAALQRAAAVPDRGYYFDLLKYRDADQRNQTPETPSIAHIHALGVALDRAFAEGVERRYARIAHMAQRCREVARQRFGLFPPEEYASATLTVFRAPAGVPAWRIVRAVAARGFTIGEGYGHLKDSTFRIAHMGEIGLETIEEVLGITVEEADRLERGG